MLYNNFSHDRQYLKKDKEKMGKFIVKKNKLGFTHSLKAGNGEIIATGGEVFSTLASCKRSIESVCQTAPIANIEDQTLEGFQKEKHPKFEIYFDKKGEYRFRLRAKNGEPLLASEGYTTKGGCKNGIESVCKNVADPIIEIIE